MPLSLAVQDHRDGLVQDVLRAGNEAYGWYQSGIQAVKFVDNVYGRYKDLVKDRATASPSTLATTNGAQQASTVKSTTNTYTNYHTTYKMPGYRRGRRYIPGSYGKGGGGPYRPRFRRRSYARQYGGFKQRNFARLTTGGGEMKVHDREHALLAVPAAGLTESLNLVKNGL